MLKLMKYEARRQVFSKGIILGILFVLVAAFFGFYWKGVDYGVTIVLALMSLATLLILVFAPFEFFYTFEKDMDTRQGYLLLMIPKKSATILSAKLLVALLQSAVLYSLFFTVVPFCERLCERKFGFTTGMIGELVNEMGIKAGVSGMADVVEAWISIILLWLFFACFGLFVAAIPGRGKLASLLGMVIFFGGIFVVFFLLFKIEALFEIIKMPIKIGNIIEWAYMLGIAVALFFGTAKLLDKKVSL